MTTRQALSVEHFHAQFHNADHHKDHGEYTKPEWHKLNPTRQKRHKGLDLTALRNSKRKKSVVVHKNSDTMRYELSRKKSK